MHKLRRSFALAAFAAAILLGSSSARAALGDRVDDKDKGVAVTTIAGHALRVRTRGNLKEFADEHGTVFAARWTGLPDLPAVLGLHLGEYEEARRAQRARGLHAVHVRTPELDVSIIVYGRIARGQAVLLKGLPQGVSVDALR